jgi:hypothetical protein
MPAASAGLLGEIRTTATPRRVVVVPAEKAAAGGSPLVNTYFETIEDLEKVVRERCVALVEQARYDPRKHIVPLVAKAKRDELIYRIWYDIAMR